MARGLLAVAVILLLLVCVVEGGGGYGGGRRGGRGGHRGSNNHGHGSDCNSSSEEDFSESSDEGGEYDYSSSEDGRPEEDGWSEEEGWPEEDDEENNASTPLPECLHLLRMSLIDGMMCLSRIGPGSSSPTPVMEDTTSTTTTEPPTTTKPPLESKATNSKQYGQSDLSKLDGSPATRKDWSMGKLKNRIVVGGIIAAALVVMLMIAVGVSIYCCHKSTNQSRVAAYNVPAGVEPYVDPKKEPLPAYVSTDLDTKKGDMESGLSLTLVQPPPVVQLAPPSYSSIDVREDPPKY